jgi:hypothetical protein
MISPVAGSAEGEFTTFGKTVRVSTNTFYEEGVHTKITLNIHGAALVRKARADPWPKGVKKI